MQALSSADLYRVTFVADHIPTGDDKDSPGLRRPFGGKPVTRGLLLAARLGIRRIF